MQPGEGTATEAILDGRYQLGECIGEGGMARVHRGFDHALGRAVAIKVMREGTENATALERARGEMGVLASLSHPSLVTLFDARIAPGRISYLVMELVEGPTLSDRLREGALEPRDVALLAGDLAEALHIVHAAGIVHRDVKPSNVLLSPSSLPGRAYRARLADFGIAYLVDSSRLTTPGVVVGTMAYLAPEQVNGAPPAPPADVYALGLLLLETLTGERPFGQIGGVESLVTRVTTAPAVPEGIGPEWADLLRAMTALDPTSRPTALEVATRAAALGPPLPAAPPTAVLPVESGLPDAARRTDRVAAPVSRRRRRGILVGAATLAAAGLVAAGAWFLGSGSAFPSPQATPAVVSEPSVAPSAPAPFESAATETEDSAVVPVDAPTVDEGSTTPEVDDAQVTPEQAPADQSTTPDQAPVPASPVGGGGGDQKAEEAAQRAAEREAAKAAEEAQRAAEKAAREEAKTQNPPGKTP